MKLLLFSLVLPVLLTAQQCAKGGVYYPEREKCLFYHPEDLTYSEAHALCEGRQLSIYDAVDETFIAKQALKSLGVDKTVWLSSIPSQTYQHLRVGYVIGETDEVLRVGNAARVRQSPRTQHQTPHVGHFVKQGQCAQLQTTNGNWLKEACSEKSSVVCVAEPLQASASCSSGYVYYQRTNQCYKFKIKDSNFLDAEGDCQNEGGHLASIHSQLENDYITSKTKTGNQGWPDDGLFIGLYYSDGKWKYTDGTSFDYQNWADGEPNNMDFEHQTSIMPDKDSPDYNPNGGQWNNIDENLRGYICKKHPSF